MHFLKYFNYKLIRNLITIFWVAGILSASNFEIGSVHSVSGDVTLFSKSKTVPVRKALPGRRIHEGDRIDTGNNGICQVVYSDGNSIIRITENSQVEFSSAGISDIIDLNYGSLYCQIGGTGANNFKIYSTIGQYITSISRFWVESHHNKSDEIIVQTGQVTANNQFSMTTAELGDGDAAILKVNGHLKADKFNELKYRLLEEESNKLTSSLDTYFDAADIPSLSQHDLIPVYLSEQPILGKNILSFRNYRYQFGQTSDASTFINIVPYYHRHDLKVGLSFPIIFGGKGFWEFDKFFYDLLDRVEYLDYFDSSNNLNVHLGLIENKTFGHGGLLVNYRNTQNKISDRRTGFDFNWSFGKKFVTLSGFVASMRDLSRGGGLMGYRAEMFMMESFPMTIGVGFIVDHNQYAEIPRKYVAEKEKDKWENEERRRVSGMEIDATYELIRGVNRQLSGWLELDYLYFSDTISYKRNLPTRKKTGTTSFRTGVDFRSGGLTGTLAMIVDSPIMLSPFFTSMYDLERMRQIKLTEETFSEKTYNDSIAITEYLSTLINTEEDSILLVPKELSSLLSGTQNVYSTPGMALKMNWSFNEYGSFGFDYGLKMEIRDNEYYEIENNLGDQDDSFTYDPKLFHTLRLEGRLGEKVMVGVSELTFLYSQYNSPSFFGFGDVFSTSEMGIRLGLRPMQFMRLIIDMQMMHYDNNSDGIIDASNSINMELRLSI